MEKLYSSIYKIQVQFRLYTQNIFRTINITHSIQLNFASQLFSHNKYRKKSRETRNTLYSSIQYKIYYTILYHIPVYIHFFTQFVNSLGSRNFCKLTNNYQRKKLLRPTLLFDQREYLINRAVLTNFLAKRNRQFSIVAE